MSAPRLQTFPPVDLVHIPGGTDWSPLDCSEAPLPPNHIETPEPALAVEDIRPERLYHILSFPVLDSLVPRLSYHRAQANHAFLFAV